MSFGLPLMADTKLVERWRHFTSDLDDSKSKNVTLILIVLAGWFVVTRVVVAITQHQHGYVLGGAADIVMLLALGFGFFSYSAIVNHNFGYVRAVALEDRQFPHNQRQFWRGVPINLGIIFVLCAIFYWLGIVAAFFAFNSFKNRHTRKLQTEYVEGTRLVSPEGLNKKFAPQIHQSKNFFWFGGVYMPIHELLTHAKIMGSSGSGKTQFLRIYMRSTLAPISMMSCEDRAILFDPKSEFYPYLRGLGLPSESITVLNPFDARAYAWDMAADLNRPRDAATLAKIMIPERKDGSSGSGEFFDKAARRVLSGLTKYFIKAAPGRWTLRDLVLGAQSMELVGLLAANDRKLARDLQVLGAGDTAGNVVATLAAVIGDELETIAAYMDYHQRQGRVFSLNRWFNGSSVLLLGCDRESEATLQPYNELLVTRFCELATSSEHPGITHAIFDEVPALGKIGKKLDELARLGRSYNIAMVIAFQAYSSLKEIYGENTANSLIGQCDKSAYLRVLDHESAEWASKQIGQTKKRKFLQGTSLSRSTTPQSWGTSVSRSTSEQESYETEPAVRPEDIMNIAKPNKNTGQGVMGFYKVASHSYFYHMSSEFMTKMGVTDDPLSAGFEAIRDAEDAEELQLWEEADLQRLGINYFLHGLDEAKLKNLPISEMASLCMEAASLEMNTAFKEASETVEV